LDNREIASWRRAATRNDIHVLEKVRQLFI